MLYALNVKKKTRNPLPLLPRSVAVCHAQEPVYRPRGLDTFQCFYCLEGEGELTIRNQRMIIRKGQAMVLYPNEPHSYHAAGEVFTVHVLMFTGTLCQDIMRSLGFYESGIYQMKEGSEALFTNCVNDLLAIKTGSASDKGTAYSKICYTFLLDFAACSNRIMEACHASGNAAVQSVISFLEENYDHPVSLSDLSDRTGLSREYLCALFKKETGTTIISFLTNLRIGYAKIKLIEYPEKRIADIGKMCGFENPSYFGKVFLERTGITPENFRR